MMLEVMVHDHEALLYLLHQFSGSWIINTIKVSLGICAYIPTNLAVVRRDGDDGGRAIGVFSSSAIGGKHGRIYLPLHDQ